MFKTGGKKPKCRMYFPKFICFLTNYHSKKREAVPGSRDGFFRLWRIKFSYLESNRRSTCIWLPTLTLTKYIPSAKLPKSKVC